MLEVEIKAKLYKVEEFEELLKKLRPWKTECVSYYDTYFDTQGGDFHADDRELRVRKITNGKTEVILTYKDKPFDESTKSKSEYEVRIDHHENLIELLKKLGYKIDIAFTKHCKNYYFKYGNYNILATLVQISELDSWFLEIEIQVTMPDQVTAAKETLFQIFSYLNIPKSALSNDYYTDLVRTSRKTNE